MYYFTNLSAKVKAPKESFLTFRAAALKSLAIS